MKVPSYEAAAALIRAHLNANFVLPSMFHSAGPRGFVALLPAEKGVVMFQYEADTIENVLADVLSSDDLDKPDLVAALREGKAYTRERVGDNNATEHFEVVDGCGVFLRMEFADSASSIENAEGLGVFDPDRPLRDLPLSELRARYKELAKEIELRATELPEYDDGDDDDGDFASLLVNDNGTPRLVGICGVDGEGLMTVDGDTLILEAGAAHPGDLLSLLEARAKANPFRPGDTVTWNDPDNGLCSRTGVLESIDYHPNGESATVVFKDGHEIEVMISELSSGVVTA